MPYFSDSQQWLHQSTLLLSARPTTTRITTKYRISPPPPARKRKATTISQADSEITTPDPPPAQQQPATSRAHLVLKTYDPVSGACLKYTTDKAAEVGRLVAALGKCGKIMSGLPLGEDMDMEGGEVDVKTEVKEEVIEPKPAVSGKEMGKGGAQRKGGGGGGKKKKGKR